MWTNHVIGDLERKYKRREYGLYYRKGNRWIRLFASIGTRTLMEMRTRFFLYVYVLRQLGYDVVYRQIVDGY